MPQFPILKTGAVAQYPLSTAYIYRADIVAFLDGSEQRFRNSPSVLHQWNITLSELDEQEMSNVETFFLALQGPTQPFAFTDPSTGTSYASCSLVAESLTENYVQPLSSSTSLVIRENRTS
jgi:hypothetical protein